MNCCYSLCLGSMCMRRHTNQGRRRWPKLDLFIIIIDWSNTTFNWHKVYRLFCSPFGNLISASKHIYHPNSTQLGRVSLSIHSFSQTVDFLLPTAYLVTKNKNNYDVLVDKIFIWWEIPIETSNMIFLSGVNIYISISMSEKGCYFTIKVYWATGINYFTSQNDGEWKSRYFFLA